jgi:hypothetical protein
MTPLSAFPTESSFSHRIPLFCLSRGPRRDCILYLDVEKLRRQ